MNYTHSGKQITCTPDWRTGVILPWRNQCTQFTAVFIKGCPLPVPASVTSKRKGGAWLVDPSHPVAALSGLWEINLEGPRSLTGFCIV